MNKDCCQKVSCAENKYPAPQAPVSSNATLNSFGKEAQHIVANPEVKRWDGHSTGSPGKALGD